MDNHSSIQRAGESIKNFLDSPNSKVIVSSTIASIMILATTALLGTGALNRTHPILLAFMLASSGLSVTYAGIKGVEAIQYHYIKEEWGTSKTYTFPNKNGIKITKIATFENHQLNLNDQEHSFRDNDNDFVDIVLYKTYDNPTWWPWTNVKKSFVGVEYQS